jgi:hypothetical protein
MSVRVTRPFTLPWQSLLSLYLRDAHALSEETTMLSGLLTKDLLYIFMEPREEKEIPITLQRALSPNIGGWNNKLKRLEKL